MQILLRPRACHLPECRQHKQLARNQRTHWIPWQTEQQLLAVLIVIRAYRVLRMQRMLRLLISGALASVGWVGFGTRGGGGRVASSAGRGRCGRQRHEGGWLAWLHEDLSKVECCAQLVNEHALHEIHLPHRHAACAHHHIATQVEESVTIALFQWLDSGARIWWRKILISVDINTCTRRFKWITKTMRKRVAIWYVSEAMPKSTIKSFASSAFWYNCCMRSCCNAILLVSLIRDIFGESGELGSINLNRNKTFIITCICLTIYALNDCYTSFKCYIPIHFRKCWNACRVRRRNRTTWHAAQLF